MGVDGRLEGHGRAPLIVFESGVFGSTDGICVCMLPVRCRVRKIIDNDPVTLARGDAHAGTCPFEDEGISSQWQG